MIVMTDYKAIIAFSVFAMLALAGSVVFVADDASAEDGAASSEFKNDSKGDYTVTYAYGGSSIVKKMSTGNQFKFDRADIAGFDAPQGYEFGEAFIDQKSGAVYDTKTPYTFTSDIIVEPKVVPAQPIVKLVYGDVSAEYMSNSSTDSYTISPDNLKDFAKKIGATVDEGDSTIVGFTIDGYKYIGFTDASGNLVANLPSDLKAENTGITTYTLVMEKVYNVTFVADGLTISNQTTANETITKPDVPSKEHYTPVGWFDKDGNEFKADSKAYTADVTYIAKYTPLTYKVFFMNGETVVAERSSEYMGQLDLPALPEGFVAWADKDGNVVGSPVTITGPDMKFYAVEEVVKCTVTFVAGDETVASVEVVKGEKLAEDQIPALPEGYDRWDFNADDAVTESIAVKGVLKVYDVTFDFGVMYAAMNVTIQVEHGQLIPADKVPVIPEAFPEKDKRWNFDASAPVTGPMTIQLRDNIYYDVAFVAGETEVAKITVLEGTAVPAEQIPALPEGYKAWDFDFEALINENTVVKAIAEEASFNVTFQIEGKTDVTQKSDSLTVPATYREGYEFQGWVVAGTSDYVDPMEYAYTGDVTFVAIYRSIAPVAPEEPGFFETTSGQIALVVIVIVVLGAVALAVAPASPMNYKLVKGKLDAAKAAKEAKKKP